MAAAGIKRFDVSSFSKAAFIDPKDVGYQDSIDIIYDELHKTRKSFIKIGWYLKHINETAMYEEDGYTNIYEFAQDKFNISQSTATRFINLCIEFSVGHDSPELDERYLDFNVSQLFEMLPMKQEEKEQVTPDMTVKKIREVKKENQVLKEPSDRDIKLFYDSHLKDDISINDRKNLKEYMLTYFGKVYYSGSGGSATPEFACTPRGIKINGSDEITWARFVKRVDELTPPITEEESAEPVEEKEDDNIPGQTSIERDFPEYMPDDGKPLSEQSDEYATSHKEEIGQTIIDGEYKEILDEEKEKKFDSDSGEKEDDLRALRDEVEELAERVRYSFWEWKAAKKMPREEIEATKKDAIRLTIAIETLLTKNTL